MRNPKFNKIIEELLEIHDRKNTDYGQDDDPMANFKMIENAGLPAWKGIICRITDKVSRLFSFMKKGTLSNEGVIDTFNDLANYAILARIAYEEYVEKLDKEK